MLRGKSARPVSWGPDQIRQASKKQNPVDVAFKEKHRNYEQIQRQATTVRYSQQKIVLELCFRYVLFFVTVDIILFTYITFNFTSIYILPQNFDSDRFNNLENSFKEDISLYILKEST